VTYMVENGRFWVLGVEDKTQKAKTIGTGQPASKTSDPMAIAKPQEATSVQK